MSGSPLEVVAQAIRAHQRNEWGQHDGWQECTCSNSQPWTPEHVAFVAVAALELREETDPDQGLAARQVLRAYIDDERLVRKAYGELLSVLGLRGEEQPSE